MSNAIVERHEAEVGPPKGPENGDITALVELAIREKVDVATLERLVALQERVQERDARMAFVQALSDFRNECPQPKKTKANSQFKRTNRAGASVPVMYSPLDEIERTARPVAAKHGLTWTWDTRVEDALMHITCRVLHIEGHSESATVAMPYESKAGASPQQKYAITQTYGQRYSLLAALGITPEGEDVDGNAPGGGDYERITDEQLADLVALMEEVKAHPPRMFTWASKASNREITNLSDLPAALFPAAVQTLESMRGQR